MNRGDKMNDKKYIAGWQKENKSGYIKDLIRKDIKNDGV